MLLSAHTCCMQHAFGYEGGIKKLKEVGFDAYDFSMFSMAEEEDDPLAGNNYKKFVLSLRKTADNVGIVCNQAHAPFPSYKEGNAKWNSSIFDYLVRSLEIASLLGAKMCVVHPRTECSAEENATLLYRPLEPYAKKFGVKVAIENMWKYAGEGLDNVPCACSTAESFLAHLNLLDEEHFVACLDTGHAELLGNAVSAVELIHALGSRLQCLHVHDNDLRHDLHDIPYARKIGWENIYKALKEARYNGELTFEVGLWQYPHELQTSAMRFLHDIGRYMISRIQAP